MDAIILNSRGFLTRMRLVSPEAQRRTNAASKCYERQLFVEKCYRLNSIELRISFTELLVMFCLFQAAS